MREKSKKLVSMLLVFTMVLCLVACGKDKETTKNPDTEKTTDNPKETQSNEKGEKKVTMAICSPWDTWNPFGSSSAYTDCVSDQIYDRLLVVNLDGTTSPRLAESYEVAEDHKSITFHLNKKAKFSDGEAVTADDVVFSFQLTTNPKFNSLKRDFTKYFEGTNASGSAEEGKKLGIEKIDEYTVKFLFKEAINELPIVTMFNRYFYIVPEHVFSKFSIDELNTSEVWKKNLCGSGPFIYLDDVEGSVLELKANKNYHLGAPDFDRLVIKVVQTSQLLSSLISQDIDLVAGGGVTTFPVTDFKSAKETEGITAESCKTYSYQTMVFNNQSKKMPSAKIRQALDMAINKQSIVDNLLMGEASIMKTGYLDYSPYFAKDLKYPEYNPEKAKQMLEEAGFDFSQTLELIVGASNQTRVQSTVLIQQNLEAIGVKVNITQYDFPTVMKMLKGGDYDLGMIGAAGSVDPSEVGAWLLPDGAVNFPCVNYDTFVNLYSEASKKLTVEEQKAVYAKIQQQMLDLMPVSYLYSENSLIAYNNKKLSNLDVNLFQQMNWCPWTWKVAE